MEREGRIETRVPYSMCLLTDLCNYRRMVSSFRQSLYWLCLYLVCTTKLCLFRFKFVRGDREPGGQ